jgi:hypothetical protein
MAEQGDRLAEWNGRELFDANGAMIGRIAGLGYPRRKFGAWWLLVETGGGEELSAEKLGAAKLFVPADQISSAHDRLVLPYSKTYVESGPSVEQDQLLSKTDERRLALHYGLDSGLSGSQCRQGCGLCMAKRRAERAR